MLKISGRCRAFRDRTAFCDCSSRCVFMYSHDEK